MKVCWQACVGAGWALSTRPACSQPLSCMNCPMPSESAESLQRNDLAASQLESVSAGVAAGSQTST